MVRRVDARPGVGGAIWRLADARTVAEVIRQASRGSGRYRIEHQQEIERLQEILRDNL